MQPYPAYFINNIWHTYNEKVAVSPYNKGGQITSQKWRRGAKTRTYRIGVGHRYMKTTIDLLDVDLDGHLDLERINVSKMGSILRQGLIE